MEVPPYSIFEVNGIYLSFLRLQRMDQQLVPPQKLRIRLDFYFTVSRLMRPLMTPLMRQDWRIKALEDEKKSEAITFSFLYFFVPS